jgi:hypothetical protein
MEEFYAQSFTFEINLKINNIINSLDNINSEFIVITRFHKISIND